MSAASDALHAKPDVRCPACRRSFRPNVIGIHRKKCDPTWTPGRTALAQRAAAERRAAERAAERRRDELGIEGAADRVRKAKAKAAS